MTNQLGKFCREGILFLISVVNLYGQSMSTPSRSDTFLVAYPKKLFNEVDIQDAQVAIELWTEELGLQLEIPMIPGTLITHDLPQMVLAINQAKADMVGLHTIDYLSIADQVSLEPALVGVKGDRFDEQLVILAHKDSEILHIKNLRDVPIFINLQIN